MLLFANLFSLVYKLTSAFWLEENNVAVGPAFKGEKSRIVSCDMCQACAILVSIFPTFPHYKEVTGGRGQIVPGVLWPHPSRIELDTCQMRRLKQVEFSWHLAHIMPPVGSNLKLRSTTIKNVAFNRFTRRNLHAHNHQAIEFDTCEIRCSKQA
jgi:hypothetical protein